MAKIVFLKPGENSQKKDYIPASIKVNKFKRIWKILALISVAFNIFLIMKGLK